MAPTGGDNANCKIRIVSEWRVDAEGQKGSSMPVKWLSSEKNTKD